MPTVRLLVATRGQAPNTLYLGDDGESLVAVGAADKQLALASDYSGFTTDGSIGDGSRAVHTVADALWVVTPADRTRQVRFTNASGVTLRVPSQLQADIGLGRIGTYRQDGAGAITVVADAGVTVTAKAGFLAKANANGSIITLDKVAAQIVRVSGDVSTT